MTLPSDKARRLRSVHTLLPLSCAGLGLAVLFVFASPSARVAPGLASDSAALDSAIRAGFDEPSRHAIVDADQPIRLHWPIGDGVSSFVTQSPASSGQAYPCGSGVNGQHILHDHTGDNEEYLHSIDIVARARNAPEQSHEGRGTAITAVADGRVVAVNMSQNECDRPFGAGNYIVVEHPQILVDGEPLRSAYMHLNSTYAVERASGCGINPRPTHSEDFQPPALGALVRAGDKLGELGNTGNSTGPHLHFQFARDCVLEPGNAVHCPSIAVLDVSPYGFSDIRIARDQSCDAAGATGGPSQRPEARSYLSDGSYVTTSAPTHATEAITASVGGP